jgi:hypothetical protein
MLIALPPPPPPQGLTLEPMLIESIDFLKALVDCHLPKIGSLVLRAEAMPGLLPLLLGYMQIKDEDAREAEVHIQFRLR